jgi:hypothetical protein
MFRALTIAREYGSGGAAIGCSISGQPGWKLVNEAFIEEDMIESTIIEALASGG